MPTLPGSIISKANSCKTATAYLLLALTAFYCTFQPLLRLALPVAHDIGFHLFQAEQFSRALGSQTVIPHWSAGSNNGYGSPNFIFYSPLGYYFIALLNLLVGSIPVSMIMAIWFSFFFSGIAMFAAVARMSGRAGALFAAILYQLLPFHLFDLYARGAFAELFAFAWFPLVLLCARGIFDARTKKRYVCGLSLAYAGLILTHLVSGYIFTFVLGAYIVFNYVVSKDGRAFRSALFAVIVGLGLSSYYLLPAIVERDLVHIDFIVKCSVGDYRNNFLFTAQGFKQGFLEFKVWLHAVAVLELLLFVSMVSVLRATRGCSRRVSPHFFFTMLFLFALFVTTPLSGPLWQVVPGFATLQFPWRWMSMMELSLCFLIGGVFSTAEVRSEERCDGSNRGMLYSLVTVSILAVVIIVKSNETYSKSFTGFDLAREYTPVSVTDLDRLVGIKREQVTMVAGVASSAVRKWDAQERVIEVNASVPALLRIKTSYYPGWQAEIDGGDAPIGIQKDSGAMLIGVPHGLHTLTLRFVDTPLRRFANHLSLLSLAMLLTWTCFNRRLLAWKCFPT